MKFNIVPIITLVLLSLSCKKEEIPEITIIQPSEEIEDTTTSTPFLTCPIDINTYQFDTLGFEVLNTEYSYSTFKPSIDILGWSFEEHQGGEIEVLASGGDCVGGCGSNVSLNNGFDKSCGLVGCWFTYLAYKTEGFTRYATDTSQVKTLFGDIDTKDEAVFWAYVNGYNLNYGNQSPKENGIKKTDLGYEVKAYKTEGSGCGQRVIRTAYHLHICPEGQITILSMEEVYNEVVYICY